ncbi:MAG: hypothetical protein IKT46_05415 [Clostridia bacterium]|nr:hypothetical protein [Clostridia bacterium]
MAENKNCFHSFNTDTVCIDCNRVLDSCRDKDCFENVRVYLTTFGQEIIEKTSSIKVKSTKVVWSCIDLEPVQFNRGFYHITVRFYTRICFEACLCPGKSQEFEGIAVTEKKIILYGSEGNVNIFKSEPGASCFCENVNYTENKSSNDPTVVCEVTDPIVLSAKVSKFDNSIRCCGCITDIPKQVCDCLSSCLCDIDDNYKSIYVTLGFFSVIRVERPCQYMINATEYKIPDKVCIEASEDDPCAAFAKMSFPVQEFSPPSYRDLNGGCGCK